MNKKKCNCHLYKNLVCDICQKVKEDRTTVASEPNYITLGESKKERNMLNNIHVDSEKMAHLEKSKRKKINDGWDKMRRVYRNLHPIRYKLKQILEKINLLDLIGATIILVSLYLVTINPLFWLLYSVGCALWCYIMYSKHLYFGMIMNFVAIIISIVNYIGSLL